MDLGRLCRGVAIIAFLLLLTQVIFQPVSGAAVAGELPLPAL